MIKETKEPYKIEYCDIKKTVDINQTKQLNRLTSFIAFFQKKQNKSFLSQSIIQTYQFSKKKIILLLKSKCSKKIQFIMAVCCIIIIFIQMDLQIATQHKCHDCGMVFYNSHELVNHTKKFCTRAGLNSLSGLAQYQNKTGLRNQNAKSAHTVKHIPEDFSPSQLYNDAQTLHRHQQQLSRYRPYQQQTPQKVHPGGGKQLPISSMSKNGSRVLGNSDVSIKPLNNFEKQPHHMAPTYGQNLPITSILNKSNTSIANMTKSQRLDYINGKLLELEGIRHMYEGGGGRNDDFMKNLQKMEKFYRKMMQEETDKPQHFTELTQLVESRVQTPINQLKQENIFKPTSMANQSTPFDDVIDRQIYHGRHQPTKYATNETQTYEKKKQKKKPEYLYPYPPPTNYPQPQIIMLPAYNPPQEPRQRESKSEELKYLQRMMEIKSDENKKLMEMLVATKKQPSNLSASIKKAQQSRVISLRKDQIYHLQQPSVGKQPLTPQEQLLISLQREQLDELKLLSSLPPELQEIKLQSVMKLIETRTNVEKEILRQKMQRLSEEENHQQLEEERKIENDKWVDQQRQRMIKAELQQYEHSYKRLEDDENESESDEESEQYDQ